MEAVRQAKEATATDLGWLLDARDDAVVTLVAGDTHLLAHRAVLSDRSPVFGAKFRRDTPEASSGSVDIPDVEGPVLRQLVAYLYNLQAPQLPGTAHKLLAAADRYGVSGLKEACERQLVAQLSVETAAAAAVLAIRHGCSNLREDAIAFMNSHLVEVMATRGYADAVRTHPQDVVEISRLLSEARRRAPVDSGTSATPAPQPLSDQTGYSQTPASATSPTATVHHGSPRDEAKESRLRRPAPADSGTSATPATQPLSDHDDCSQTPASAEPPTDAGHCGSPHDEASNTRLSSPAPVDSGTSATPAPQPLSDQTGYSQTPASATSPTATAHHGTPRDEAKESRLSPPAPVDSGTSATPAPQLLSDHGDCSQTPASAASPMAAAHHGTQHGAAADAQVSSPAAVDSATSPNLTTQQHSDCSHTPASATSPTATVHHGSPHDGAADSLVSSPAPADSGTSATPVTQPLSDQGDCSHTPASAEPPMPTAQHDRPHDEATDSRVSSPASVDSGTSAAAATQPIRDHSDCGQASPSAAPPTAAAHHSEAAYSRKSGTAPVRRTFSVLTTQAHSQNSAAAEPSTAGPAHNAVKYRVRNTAPLRRPFSLFTTQPHSNDSNGSQTSTTAVPPSSIESRMRSPVPVRRPFSHFIIRPHSSDSDGSQTSAADASPSPAATLNRPPHFAAEYRLRSPLPVRRTFSMFNARQRSDSKQSPASAAATRSPPPHEDAETRLRRLSPQEKARRLIEAAWHGDVGELEVLLAAGADVAARDDNDRGTALHWAARGGHVEAARRLLAAGAAVGATGEWRQTPLHWAAANGRAGAVRLLLAAGADPGATGEYEETPLHLAAEGGHGEVAAALLEGGAGAAARDSWGRTPLDVARRSRRQQLVELLQAGGGPAAGAAL